MIKENINISNIETNKDDIIENDPFELFIKQNQELKNVERISEKNIDEMISKIEASEAGESQFQKIIEDIIERIRIECGDIGTLKIFTESLKVQVGHTADDVSVYDEENKMILIGPSMINDLKLSYIVGALSVQGFSVGALALHHESIHSTQFHEPEVIALEKKEADRRFYIQIAAIMVPTMIAMAAIDIKYILTLPASVTLFFLKDKQQYNKDIRPERILKEVHAYYGSDRYTDVYGTRDTHDGDVMNQGTLHYIDYLQQVPYKFSRDPEAIDQMVMALQEVKRLYALSLTDAEIGELVKEAKWDPVIVGYDTLEQHINEIIKERGIEEEDLDNLVLLDDLKRKVYYQKVQLIAQEELKKAYQSIT